MKRIYAYLLCAALLFHIGAPAFANSWNVTGALLRALSSVHTWDGYSAMGKQAGDAAVMGSRYHNALMLADDAARNGLRVYTKAVYQPGEALADRAALTRTREGFTLSYGESERYAFALAPGAAGDYLLREAVIGDFRLSCEIARDVDVGVSRYTASDGRESAVWSAYLPLPRFNIRLLPRSVADVRAHQHMRASLDSGADCLGWWEDGGEPGARLYKISKGVAPVYASPYGEASWRAANGKAAVALSGELWRLGLCVETDDVVYASIRYDVSERTQRIGYVRLAALSGEEAWDSSGDLIHVDACATRATYLTDDPDVSQYAQFVVPEGTLLECMGMYNDDYAYVSAEVKGERFTDGGAIVWGFVPLRDLAPLESEPLTDVMARLAGAWSFEAGGSMAEDAFFFDPDGSYLGGHIDAAHGELVIQTRGTWSVIAYNAFSNHYWNDPPYQITLLSDDGAATVRGLTLTQSGFSLTDWEGGGGYIRYDGALRYIDVGSDDDRHG